MWCLNFDCWWKFKVFQVWSLEKQVFDMLKTVSYVFGFPLFLYIRFKQFHNEKKTFLFESLFWQMFGNLSRNSWFMISEGLKANPGSICSMLPKYNPCCLGVDLISLFVNEKLQHSFPKYGSKKEYVILLMLIFNWSDKCWKVDILVTLGFCIPIYYELLLQVKYHD